MDWKELKQNFGDFVHGYFVSEYERKLREQFVDLNEIHDIVEPNGYRLAAVQVNRPDFARLWSPAEHGRCCRHGDDSGRAREVMNQRILVGQLELECHDERTVRQADDNDRGAHRRRGKRPGKSGSQRNRKPIKGHSVTDFNLVVGGPDNEAPLITDDRRAA